MAGRFRRRRVSRALALLATAGALAGCSAAGGGGATPAAGPSPAAVAPSSGRPPAGTQVEAVAATPARTPSACPPGGASTARTAASTASAPLVRVAAATGGCSDRLVLEFAGRVDGYDVRYVPQVLADASGRPVPVAGGARLKVTVVAPAYDASGATFLPADPAHVTPVPGFATFRQVAWAGSFEGSTTLALGVRARLPFRVSVLPGPGTHSRVVVDVYRGW